MSFVSAAKRGGWIVCLMHQRAKEPTCMHILLTREVVEADMIGMSKTHLNNLMKTGNGVTQTMCRQILFCRWIFLLLCTVFRVLNYVE